MTAPIHETRADVPSKPTRPAPPGLGSGTGQRHLAMVLSQERERWILWAPVALGFGIGFYFLAPVEPAWWAGASLCALGAGLAVIGRAETRGVALALAILGVGIGFTAAQARTALVDTPMLGRSIGFVGVAGDVVAVDRRLGDLRVTLDAVEITPAPDPPGPDRVRVRFSGDRPPAVGSRIAFRANLSGPRGPAAPGAFDFRRRAFFGGIGAVGFAVGPYELVRPAASLGLSGRLETAREAVVDRVREALPTRQSGIAAALLTGERGGIPAEVYETMRDAGLAHLLAISGLHVGLVAGCVFAAVRGLLAFVQPIALRWPIKKWAAGAALVAAFAYTALVGAPVPTQRAFLMTGIVLIAVMCDRNPFSMRLVALAAVAILLFSPESLLNVSFQMSFAAVIALVAVYEGAASPLGRWRRRGGLSRTILLYGGSVLLTTLVASTATSLFALYHFNRIPTLGLVANLAAVPLTAFWIMPWGLVAFLAMPFGLESYALAPMGWGIQALVAIAEAATSRLGGSLVVPAMPPWGLVPGVLGALWLCLWHRPWRWWGAIAIVFAFASPMLTRPPDLIVHESGRLAAVLDADDRLTVSTLRRERFVRDLWLRRAGQVEAEAWPETGSSPDGALVCDPLACVYWRSGQTVAIVRDGRALGEDCRVADVVIAAVAGPRGCAAETVVDRFDLWRDGTHALWLSGDTVRTRTTADAVGDRPWSTPQ